jgi:hypothetical protein
MHTTEHSQIGPQAGLHILTRIGVRFARPIPIGIARPFVRPVTDRGMWALNRGIAVIFIGVDMCSWPSEPLDMRAQSALLRKVGRKPQVL